MVTRTLWSLQAGEECRIEAFDGKLEASYRVRMMDFGFSPGERVSCVLSPGLGAPKIYRVSNTTFSLDDEIATHILVSLLADE